MPEYLAPGVFVEEVSFRAKSIEGVPTSTTGFAGIAQFGPVHYPDGPLNHEPRLVTSFPEFERAYGKLDSLTVGGDVRLPYLAHAARAFFLNGGHRLYVSRVFRASSLADTGIAWVEFDVPTPTPGPAFWRARWPGSMGNVAIVTSLVRSRDVARHDPKAPPFANLARDGTIVEVVTGTALPDPKAALNPSNLRVVRVAPDGSQTFVKLDGTPGAPAVTDLLSVIDLTVLVQVDPDRADAFSRMGVDPNHSMALQKVFDKEDPHDEDSVVWLDYDFGPAPGGQAISLLMGLVGTGSPPGTTVRLAHGNDGALPTADDFLGQQADPDDITKTATGLEALGEVDDIAIEAVPDAGALPDDERNVATGYLINHCERSRYRIAVVDGPPRASINEIREFRAKFDSSYGALYHPWVEILDPNQSAVQGVSPSKIVIPPSGFVTGIYARTDITRGVFKAPANEVVYGLTKFEVNINQGRNEVLNPEGINALRFFPGRSYRVWGARTLTSDPEWKYVNVRRLFVFLEHSIDKATQWAVFEPNNDALWRNVAQEISDFLEVQWRDGALLGSTPSQAYFVRCDRTTMTQNDIDNGRMICLIGVAPTRPAEFVIFRIGQWTADART